MKSLSVIEHLNPLSDHRSGKGSGREDSRMNQLGFEGAEEAFRHSIIPAITSTAHAAGDLGMLQGRLVVPTGILGPPIRSSLVQIKDNS